MSNLRLRVENGLVKNSGYRTTQLTLDELPMDLKKFLMDRAKALQTAASKELLFEVQVQTFVNEQVENLWQGNLKRAYEELYGEGTYAEIAEEALQGMSDDRSDTVSGIEVYFEVIKPVTVHTLNIYGKDALDAGEKAKSTVKGEDLKIVAINQVTGRKR